MSEKYNGDLIKLAKQLRKNATPWENKLWYEFLREYQVRFQRQKVIDNYIVDFYCAKAKLGIELDGGGHYSPEKLEADRIRSESLLKIGIEIIRFSNLDVDKSFYEVCESIDNKVKERLETEKI